VLRPARAEMDLYSGRAALNLGTLPRTRGDGPVGKHALHAEPDSPPHARGWTPRRHLARAECVLSPARAGMDLLTVPSPAAPAALPRTRGDGPVRPARMYTLTNSPPHARGWTQRLAQSLAESDLSPARAGMDPASRMAWASRQALPRTRGDGPA